MTQVQVWKTASKATIVEAYLEELKLMGHAWTADPAKLANAERAARDTLNGHASVDLGGHCWLRALERNGLFSREARTLKALHALPATQAAAA